MVDRLLLVGMMGAGKTTVGRLVAGRLGWGYFDSDDEVMAATGRSVPEIFAQDGEAAFRAEESSALRRAVAGDEPVVVSVAGGAVLAEENRQLLAAAGVVVWLRARTDTLAGRVGKGDGRPLLGDDPAGVLALLSRQRAPLYASLASAVVDVDDRGADEVAEDVLAALGAAAGAPDVAGAPASLPVPGSGPGQGS